MHRPAPGAMTRTTFQSNRIQVLLNTLFAERYARRALLSEVLEELAAADALSTAVHVGRRILENLEVGMADDEYQCQIAGLIQLTNPPCNTSVTAVLRT
jgi:hypothetical protein